MRYFKARKVDYAPYLIFDLVAYSLKELESKGFISNCIIAPGILTENNLPGERNGICLLDLDENGNIVPRASVDFEKASIEKEIEATLKEIEEYKSYLKKTDWIVSKCTEIGLNIQEEYPEYYSQRKIAREAINTLEKKLNL